MSIQLTVEVQDVNTILEGLQRIGDNAHRVASIVREQGTDQFEAMQAAAQAAHEAAKPAGDAPQA